MLNILIVIILFVLLRVVLFKNIKRRRANVFNNENQDLIVDIKEEDLIIDVERESELVDVDED